MSGNSVSWSPQGHHKRPHEAAGGGPNIPLPPPAVYHNQQQQQQPPPLPVTAGADSGDHHQKYPFVCQPQDDQQQQERHLDNSSQESSHKRARLYGEYRENSSLMEEDSSVEQDEDGETALCSNVAVRTTSEDASSRARWLLRSSPSNFSITSTLTEVSDTMDGTLETTDIILEGTPAMDVRDQVESITNRMEHGWSLTRMKTRRISNTLAGETASSDQSREIMSDANRRYRKEQTKQAKRQVMRAFRKSNSATMDYGL